MIKDKLTRLEANINTLQKIKDTISLKDVTSEKIDEWGLRYGFFESIQIVIDVSCHLVSERNLGSPEKYRDCIVLLQKAGYISLTLAESLLGMVGLRNLLIHDYGVIDVSKLYGYLSRLDDFREFISLLRPEAEG